jgi:two-component system LytT family sensor kinase
MGIFKKISLPAFIQTMYSIIKPRHISIALHGLIWSILLLLPYFVSIAGNGYKIGAMPGLFFTICGFIHMLIFYVNAFFLYPKLYNKRFWWLYFIAAIALIIVSFQLKYIVLALWFPGVLQDQSAYKFVFAPSFAVFIISILYRRIVDKIHFEQLKKEQEATQLFTELKFLRSQISPHFLFNVLTNLVSLARKKSDKLEQSLIMLSDLLRYMLYDTQGKKVGLLKEIEYLNSYIELQKLRFGNDVQVDCYIEIDSHNDAYNIEPMLLIPFVENAFKHGAGFIEAPWIGISLSVLNGLMVFEVQNKFDGKHDTSKDETSGIGLSNVKSRLLLLYKNRHELTINDDGKLFQTLLTLQLT